MKQASRALNTLQTLYQVTQALSDLKNPTEVLQNIVDLMAQTLPADRVLLITFDLETRQVSNFIKGGPDAKDVVEVTFDELWDGIYGWVVRGKKPFVASSGIDDLYDHLQIRHSRTEMRTGSIIGIPLRCQNEVPGILAATTTSKANKFRQQDLELMTIVASQITLALDNIHLNRVLQSTNAEFTETSAQLQNKVNRYSQIEAEQTAHLRFFESMNQINQAIQGTNDLEQMMIDVLDLLLSIFDCDRAWLVYPCDPEAATWQVPMERTRPEYPGVVPIGVELPLDPTGAAVYRILRETPAPVQFGPGSNYPVPVEMAQGFKVQAFIATAFYPKVGLPWSFGLHQCSYARIWTAEEERLFQEIGRRLADGLTGLLSYRKLQESENRYRTLFNLMDEGVGINELVYDDSGEVIDYKIIDVNPAFTRHSIYRSDQVVGCLATDLYKMKPEFIREWWRNHIKANEVVHTEMHYEPTDRWFHIITSPVTGNQFATFSTDITQRKRAEQTLALREQESRTLLENIPDLIVRYDTNLRRIYVNPAWEKASGLSAEEVVNVPPESIPQVPQPIVANYLEKLQTVLKTGIPEKLEFTWINARGKTLFLNYRIVPEYGQNGKIISILSVGHDITERREIEKTLQQYNQRLSLLHEIDRHILVSQSLQVIANTVLELLMQLIPCEFASIVLYNDAITEEQVFAYRHSAGVITVMQTSHPVVLNQILEKLKSGHSAVTPDLGKQEGSMGYLAEELVAQGIHSAMANPLIVQDHLIGTLALASQQVDFFIPDYRQIAEEVAAQIAIAIQHAKLNDQIIQYNAELEQRVAQRTAQLETANHELELLSYSVSHDLRAPLRAIQSFSEIIARRHRSSLNDESRRYFDYIVTASEQMNQLIEDLLGYARLGRQRLRLEAIPIARVLSEVVENLKPQIEQTGARIGLPNTLPRVQGDKTLLKQIFSNLLQNAIVYHRPGISPVIDISASVEDEDAVICVADNGIGIPPEFYEKIFNIFQRLHSPEQYPGTGIGLAIVRRSVELLNGAVRVESKVDEGTSFYIRLPVAVK